MTDVAADPTLAERPRRSGVLGRLLGGLKNLVIGTAFCLTPPTAVLALGWLVRMMRAASLRRLGAPDAETRPVNWLLGSRGAGPVERLFGAFWLNLKTGLGSLAALLVATLPFTGLGIFSWWAGWENSFNKGYEQAWVGPVVALIGIAISLWVMTHLPLALAHRAVEGRWLALFEVRRIRSLLPHVGVRSFALAVFTVGAALPLAAAKGLPVFVEQFEPRFPDMTADEQAQFAGRIALLKAAYLFAVLVILRRWAATLYARAAPLAVAAREPLWRGTVVHGLVANRADQAAPGRASWWMTRLVGRLILMAVWFGLVAQTYVTQFLNHAWWYWINHPLLVLPWAG